MTPADVSLKALVQFFVMKEKYNMALIKVVTFESTKASNDLCSYFTSLFDLELNIDLFSSL